MRKLRTIKVEDDTDEVGSSSGCRS